ncbi:MAG: GNAT family N-acetyltransferase [bacterium]|nr:GNAT family N-acetyltransferase [bacterium]
MISIVKATEIDYKAIVKIGKISVAEAHKESCSVEDMNAFIERNYNNLSIQEELKNSSNIYHILYCNKQPSGFSKIVLNAEHSDIQYKNVTKLDRIYLLKEIFDLKLGLELINFNIKIAKQSNQFAMWLFVWKENHRAVNFYKKIGFKIIGNYDFKITENHSNPNYQMMLSF